MKDKKVVIVHDWLLGGGAEMVVLELHRLFPDAPIYTSFATDEWRERLGGKVVTGYLQKWPFNKLRKFIPMLRAYWFSNLDLSSYDLIISTSGAEAKAAGMSNKNTLRVKPLHVNYCFAPTHYYWSRYDEYLKHPGFGPFDWLARFGLKKLVSPMRNWDLRAAKWPKVMIASSSHIQLEIENYYHRDTPLIFPPVETERFRKAAAKKRSGFVITGRQTPYKRFDLAVAACTRLNLPLKVAGDGPDNARLRSMAGPTVEFLGKVPFSELPKLVGSAQAFLFPGLDDFGISPVEALAAGTPVIAYRGGGALDYVNGRTGMFFEEQTVDSLAEALQAFDPKLFSAETIQKSTEQFSPETFQRKFHELLDGLR